MGNKCNGFVWCGPGAHAPDNCNNEYERFQDFQEHEADIYQLVAPVEAVEELEDMLQMSEQVHMQLVYRPEDDEYQYMVCIPRPVHADAPAPPPQEPPDVWLTWLHEHVNYGEPW